MSNEGNPNPNIAKEAVGYRFGEAGGADPKAASKKGNEKIAANWEVRHALRRLSAAEFDIDEKITIDKLAKVFVKDKKTLTGAQILACRNYSMALGSEKAMKDIIENIDGKQLQKVVSSQVSLADLVNGSFEDAK